MTLAELLGAVAGLSGILFVVTSMLAMGLSLTTAAIMQPLKNVRLVVLALLANFVLAPLLAYGILLVIPLEQSLATGLIVLSTAAGAPFLPRLVQGAKGDVAFGVGLMVLLMVVTIGYMPIVLPFLRPGVDVNPWAIAQSLIVVLLIPLVSGLFFNSHSPDSAAHGQPTGSPLAARDDQGIQRSIAHPSRRRIGAQRLQHRESDQHRRPLCHRAVHPWIVGHWFSPGRAR